MERLRFLEDNDEVNPFFFFNAINDFKKSIENERPQWDIKSTRWHLFTATILDFPIPLTINIGYDFYTNKLDV
jgi:hypothetical protein